MNNLYNKECCLRCFGCRVIILDDNSNNLYNKECCSCCFGCRLYFWGRQLEQPVQPRMLSPLFWLSSLFLRTTTETTCTTKNVVLVVLVVVLYFKDDNWNNLYNQESCRGTKIIAHLSENVNLVVINLDKRRRANRSEKALRRAKNANRRHTLGERISCLGERKSCRPNSGARSACPAAGRRGRLAGVS